MAVLTLNQVSVSGFSFIVRKVTETGINHNSVKCTHSLPLLAFSSVLLLDLTSVLLYFCFRFQVKFFYLTQLAYWLHALPELYFQKVRKVSKEALGTGGVLECD